MANNKASKIPFLILGISWIIFGLGITIDPTFYDTRHHFYYDFAGYNVPLGIALIIVGIFCIWTSFKKKKKE